MKKNQINQVGVENVHRKSVVRLSIAHDFENSEVAKVYSEIISLFPSHFAKRIGKEYEM